jgi:hypothetical protein
MEALLEMALRIDILNIARFVTGGISGSAIGFLLSIGIHSRENL